MLTYVTPDNKFLLVANQGDEQEPGTTVSFIDLDTFTVATEVETGQGAHGIVVDPSGTHAYVTNLYSNDVAVLDLETRTVVATIEVGAKPNGISFSPLPTPEQPPLMLDVPRSPGQRLSTPRARVTTPVTDLPLSGWPVAVDRLHEGSMKSHLHPLRRYPQGVPWE